MNPWPDWPCDWANYCRATSTVDVVPNAGTIWIDRPGSHITCYAYSRRSYLRLRALLGPPVFDWNMAWWYCSKRGNTYAQHEFENLYGHLPGPVRAEILTMIAKGLRDLIRKRL